MKKFFLILFILSILAAIGVAAFILTFDANQWKPLIIQQLEILVGNKVRIDNLALRWNNGIALEIEQFEIGSNRQLSNKPLLEVESASASIRLMPLLHRDIQIGAIEISRPRIQINKSPAGIIQILGITPAHEEAQFDEIPKSQTELGRQTNLVPKSKSTAGPPSPTLADSLPLSLFIKMIKITGGDITFIDQTPNPQMVFHTQNLDLILKNVSLTRWIDFQVQAEIFSNDQNLKASGRFRIPKNGSGIELENTKAETSLESIDFLELQKTVPTLTNLNTLDGIKGNVLLELEHFENSEHLPIKSISGKAQIKDGLLPLGAAGHYLQNLSAQIHLDSEKIDIQKLFGNIAVGKSNSYGDNNAISINGTIFQWLSLPKLDGQINISKLNLDQMAPTRRGDPKLIGLLDLQMTASGVGKSWEQISSNLTGKGTLNLDEPAVLNFNLLKEILAKISAIPGLMDRLKQQLPDQYWEKLNEKDTMINPIQQEFMIQNGFIVMNRLNIQTEVAELTGTAEVGLNGVLGLQTMISMEGQLSDALTKSVTELQYLTSKDGRIQLPVKITGMIPYISVLPDLQYIASRLAVAKTQEFVSSIFKPKQDPTQSPTSQTSSLGTQDTPLQQTTNAGGIDQQQTQPQQNPADQQPFNLRKVKGKDILGSLLQAALETSGPQDSQEKQPQ